MASGDVIRYLARDQIDISKWDECIASNSNGIVYANSLFLDQLSDNWSAIVIGDYTALMPLPWRRKWGIKYYYKPPFIQQLGIVGSTDKEQDHRVWQMVWKKIRYGDIMLNFSNTDLAIRTGAQSFTNLVIDLSKGYSLLSAYYKSDLRQNLKRACKDRMLYLPDNDPRSAIDLFHAHYKARIRSLTTDDYNRFSVLCELLVQKQLVLVRKVTDAHGALLSVALLVKDRRRIYNIMNTVLAEGKKISANHFLLDRIICEFSGQNLMLDLEGSEVEGIRHFYENFGAANQPYFLIRRLPFILQLLRR